MIDEKEYRKFKRERKKVERQLADVEKNVPEDERIPFLDACLLAKWEGLTNAIEEYESQNQ